MKLMRRLLPLFAVLLLLLAPSGAVHAVPTVTPPEELNKITLYTYPDRFPNHEDDANWSRPLLIQEDSDRFNSIHLYVDGELSETIALSDGLRSFSKSVVFAQPQEHTYRVVAEGVGGQIRSNDLVIQWRTTLPIIDFKGELEARGDTNTAIFIIPFGVGLVTGLVNPVGGLVMFLVTFSTLIVMLDANPFLWLVVVLTAALGTAAFFMLRRV